MAFEGLSEKLNGVFKRLRGKGRLTEADVREGMREVRLALLEADVSYKVVKDFVADVTEKCIGTDVLDSLTPAQQIIKIVNQELTALMGGTNARLTTASKGPTVVMMVGLQGAGKTTNGAKLAGLMRRSYGKRPLLVVEAMTGQDAVNAAKAFDDALGIDGVLLTKLDGDARGGAALSIRAVTGKPIKFVGTGEKLDMIEPFHPDRMAGRILGMGDMLTFIEKAEQQYDEKQAKKLEEKLRKNRLTLSDYLDQMEQLQNMGDLSQIAGMLPGNLGKSFDPDQIDEKQMAHNKAIILSMTPLERENHQILNASRKKRIAAGCGLEVVDVNRLLKSFEMLQQMTSAMAKGKMRGGLGGLMGGMGGKVAKGAMHGFGRKKRLK